MHRAGGGGAARCRVLSPNSPAPDTQHSPGHQQPRPGPAPRSPPNPAAASQTAALTAVPASQSPTALTESPQTPPYPAGPAAERRSAHQQPLTRYRERLPSTSAAAALPSRGALGSVVLAPPPEWRVGDFELQFPECSATPEAWEDPDAQVQDGELRR